MMRRWILSIAVTGLLVPWGLFAQDCQELPTAAQLKQHLISAADDSVGGLFNGARSWAAVVNRSGELCAFATSTDDPTQVWPGSQAIAKAKAYTANAFSLDVLPLSTARLYTFTQPGHSLHSLGQSNLFNPEALAPPDAEPDDEGIVGGLIFFGGGVPLYRDGEIIGGLGSSGDTSCADHEIAKRVRNLAGLNPPQGMLSDDILYAAVDGASAFVHPVCVNTFRNGIFVGNELPATADGTATAAQVEALDAKLDELRTLVERVAKANSIVP